MTAARVMVFGDSITLGTWDTQGGWADRLKRNLHLQTIKSQLQTTYQLYNLGIGSETSSNLAARAEPEVRARLSKSWPFVFVVAIGINDGRVRAGSDEPEVSPSQTIKNLDRILSVFNPHSDRVLVIGPTPIKSAELKFKDLLYKRDAIEQTSRLQKEWAADNKLPFVELFDTLQDSPAYLDSLVDGLHPGDRGAEEIYARVKPRLMPILES